MKHLAQSEESARIEREYARNDSSGISDRLYRYENPAFLFHMQERERAILSALRRLGIVLSGSHLLEVGCGNGHILQRFLEFGAASGCGVDLMANRILDGATRYPNLKLHQGDASRLPFEDEQFHLVMQFMCLSSVLDPSMRRQIASEMWRVLKPGGAILSYDLRQTGKLGWRLVRLLRFLMAKDLSYSESTPGEAQPQATIPIQPLTLSEVQGLFDQGQLDCQSVSLDFSLARAAASSDFLTRAMASVPALRTHYLVVVRKIRPSRVGDRIP
jgi:ubiquinone/menaquinone biosynthesis C-methylase UbiE